MLKDLREVLCHGWGWRSPLVLRRDSCEVTLVLSLGFQQWVASPTHPRAPLVAPRDVLHALSVSLS